MIESSRQPSSAHLDANYGQGGLCGLLGCSTRLRELRPIGTGRGGCCTALLYTNGCKDAWPRENILARATRVPCVSRGSSALSPGFPFLECCPVFLKDCLPREIQRDCTHLKEIEKNIFKRHTPRAQMRLLLEKSFILQQC